MIKALLQRVHSFLSPFSSKKPEWSLRGGEVGYEACPVELPGGSKYHLVYESGTEDLVARSYINGHKENEHLIELLLRFTPKAGRVLDLGAHMGTFSLAAAAIGHDVVAVDAAPIHIDLLQRGVLRNGFRRVRVVQAAVGERSGVVEFQFAGLWGMVATPGCDLPEVGGVPAVKVPGFSGDELLKTVGWDRVDFIKMDIEGSEVAAARGLKELLRRPDAPVVVYECNSLTLPQFGFTTHDLVRTFEDFGYRSYRVEEGGFRPFRSEDFQPEMYLDIVALKSVHENFIINEVKPAPDTEELIRKTVMEAERAHENYRAHIAKALACAPRAIVCDARVQSALENLARDPIKDVREAAEWFCKPQLDAA